MKKTLFNFSMSFFICFILGVLIALLLAILKTNNALSAQAADICISSLSVVVFFLFGFIFSFRQKKRGLLNGLLLIAFYVAIYFILKSFGNASSPVYLTVSRGAAILIGSLFGVNLSPKSDQTY